MGKECRNTTASRCEARQETLNDLILNGIKRNWDRMSLSDMGGINYRYRDVAEMIEKLRIIFEAAGVGPGDKVAICGKNSSNWAVVFVACLASGVVAVPLLHEFKPDMIHRLVNHSDAKLLFVDASIWENLDEAKLPSLVGAIYISEFGMPLSRSEHLSVARDNLNERFGRKFPYSYGPDDFKVYADDMSQTAIISYTSGSTGMSKGVVLPRRSIWSNVRFCLDNVPFLLPGDGMVNMLPLAHLYGMVIEMLHPFCKGVHCNFLTRLPSPKVIMQAFQEVRPKLIITVPLILEKIVKGKIFPKIENSAMLRLMLKLPVLDDKVLAKINRGLIDALGGNVKELIIGGAPLNGDVERLLRRMGFPYTVGYGMTECGPLLTYIEPSEVRAGTVGKCVPRMSMRVDSPDPAEIAGNLWVKGDNVMTGYYKNPQATADVMMPDGWMNTGDMCRIDAEGYVTVCGRSKTMILGPSGQNIYPEEIEAVLNNLPYVGESLVIDKGGRLQALIYPDTEAMELKPLDAEGLARQMDNNLNSLNNEMPSYSKVSSYKIMSEEFEKTPKRSIKRFLYS